MIPLHIIKSCNGSFQEKWYLFLIFELIISPDFCVYCTGGERHESEAWSLCNQCIRDTENVQSRFLQKDGRNSLYPDVDSHGESACFTARAEVLERSREGIRETENYRDRENRRLPMVDVFLKSL